MADVFISYARENRSRVEPLVAGFSAGGLAPWWDRNLIAGDNFAQVIERELTACGSAVIVWSAAARESLWVRAEASLALDQGKLIQLRLDRARPPLPFNIVSFHDFTAWTGSRAGPPWTTLVRHVRATIAGEPPPVATPTAPPQGSALQGLESMTWFGWASIVLGMGTAGAAIAAAQGQIGADLFRQLAAGAFGASCLCLAAMLWRFVRIAIASGRG